LIPAEIMRRELEGESPVKLWREHHGLTQQQLADAAEISKPFLSQIEALSAIARALGVPLDLLTE